VEHSLHTAVVEVVEMDLVETLVDLVAVLVVVDPTEMVTKLPEHKLLLRHLLHNHKH
tara:strand:- start:341 stop:511 length:171 start_codon:yes stop_codon:yes gene_type:complete